jgi:hypothetical protein
VKLLLARLLLWAFVRLLKHRGDKAAQAETAAQIYRGTKVIPPRVFAQLGDCAGCGRPLDSRETTHYGFDGLYHATCHSKQSEAQWLPRLKIEDKSDAGPEA